MLLWLLHTFCETLGHDRWAAVEKITFRGALAATVAFTVALVLGPRLIAWLRRRFREPNTSDSAELRRLHQSKHATPTMGGLFLVAGLLGALVLLGDLTNPLVHIALLVTVGLGLVGVVDDLVKLRGNSNGISARSKLAGQLTVATIAAFWLYAYHTSHGPSSHASELLTLWIPLADIHLPIGWGFVPLAVLVIVGTSNAVNLTDGLDGLAGGCLVLSIGAMAAVAYAAGHAEMADYLKIARVPGAGEMAVLAAAMIGGLLGFLWFNCHPAQVFMGDTGSLPLGGLLGLIALAARQEMLLLLVAGVFVVEAASVVIQVGVYQWRRRRVFRCAPLHHHFQFKGLAESQIVVRFWIASAICALLGLACLKVDISDPPSHISTSIAEHPIERDSEKMPPPAPAKQYSVQQCEYLTGANRLPVNSRSMKTSPNNK